MTWSKAEAEEAAYIADHAWEIDLLCPCGHQWGALEYDDGDIDPPDCPECGTEGVRCE